MIYWRMLLVDSDPVGVPLVLDIASARASLCLSDAHLQDRCGIEEEDSQGIIEGVALEAMAVTGLRDASCPSLRLSLRRLRL